MRKFIAPFLLLILIIIVFHAWFFPGLLSTFDFPYFSPLMMKNAGVIPHAWGWHSSLDGFAMFLSPYSWVFPLIYVPQVIFGNLLGMSWSLITKIIYLYPYLILAVISPILLIRYIFPKNNFYLLAVLIFLFNTYALMLAGGEVFLTLAYVLLPLILIISIKTIDSRAPMIKNSIVLGLLVSAQIMFDPRVAYMTMFTVGIYFLFNICNSLILRRILYAFIIPGIIVVLLNTFWIFPSIMHGGNPVETLGVAYSATTAVNYLSFAKFENTISLLHPNWPENIFGKVSFMKPGFILLPILAFASLLFINKLKDKREKLFIIFFSFLGLLGAFLSKGSNDPFGGIYLWLFKYFPGFELFRDASKWYLLIALSYTILIPFSTWKIYEWLSRKNRFSILNFQNFFLFLVIFYLLFLIRPAIFGQLGGVFKTVIVPQDYARFEKFLYNQPEYFRTLWFPSKQRFGYYSQNHPEMSATALFNLYDNQNLFKKLQENTTEKILEEASIKYVIVPYDSEGEIFLTDRKYDKKLYLDTINELKTIKWLRPIDSFGRIIVFENLNYKDHFWSSDSNLKINYKYINPTLYEVDVRNAKKGDILVFSEAYDSNWTANAILSSKYNLFNSFILPKDGSYKLTVYYIIQDYVNIGLWISTAALLITLGSIAVLVKAK